MNEADIVRFREIAFSMPKAQLDILKSAATSGDAGRGMVMCRLYYPNMSAVDAEKFMAWLRQQNEK